MTEAPLEGKEAGQDLWQLALERQPVLMKTQMPLTAQLFWSPLTMAMNGPKDAAQTDITMALRASRRSGLKLVQLMVPSEGQEDR